jgi:hypothetical protein
MRWSMVVLGVLVASGVATEAPALSPNDLPQAPLAAPPAPPAAPPTLLLPPHLAGGFPRGWAADLQGLPTIQDLGAASPTYTAPPPRRQRTRQP